jgi:Bacterial PH domain
MTTIPDDIRRELTPGEQVLWSERPRQGLILRSGDSFGIPFSVFWAGFVFYWMHSAMSMGAPLPFLLFGSAFVMVGIYVTVGRFLVDAVRRGKTSYALTNERVLIVTGIWGRRVKSIELKGIGDLSLSERKEGWGTISLGPQAPLTWMLETNASWPGIEERLGPRFELVPNVRQVFELIRSTRSTRA